MLVVVLLDDRREDARHADAVATHHHRVLLAVLVGVVRVERDRVLRAELEHVADLDTAVDRERLPAPRARVAGHDRHEVAHTSTVKSRPSTALRTWWSAPFAPVTHTIGAATEGSATTTEAPA